MDCKAHLVGKVITRGELAARWAYSEMKSSRRAEWYANPPQDLVDKAEQNIAFEDLQKSDRDHLRNLIQSSSERNQLLLRLKSSHFKCVEWSKVRLLDTRVAVGGELMKDFASARRSIDPKDPRSVATEIGIFPECSDPIIATPMYRFYSYPPFFNMLLDGILRSLLFLRYGSDTDLIKVWTDVS